MVVFERSGTFVPSRLHKLLLVNGVDALGVTNTATAVQIICQEGTDPGNVDAAIAAYPLREQPGDPPTRYLLAVIKQIVSAADFPTAQVNLRALVLSMVN